MNRILVTGHSLINYRQYSLFLEMSEQYPDSEILILPPDKWRDETIKPFKKDNFEIKPLKYLGSNYNFVRYWLDGLENEIEKFNPSVIYIEQEPYSLFANTLIKLIKENDSKIKVCLFTWENKYSLFEYYSHYGYGDVWRYCLKKADLIVCGNKLAEEVSKKIYPNVKTAICPQYGINIKTFKYKQKEEFEEKEEPEFSIGYAGRFIEEKGIRTIEKIAKDLQLKFLITGGRGDYNFTYGKNLGWLPDYNSLADKFYQNIKVLLTLPYNHNDYSEQYNATIGEAMSMKLPVICTDNGSISDVYKGSPAIIIPQEDIAKGDTSKIIPILKTLLEDKKERNRLGKLGRKFVIDNISNRRISEKLYNILIKYIKN